MSILVYEEKTCEPLQRPFSEFSKIGDAMKPKPWTILTSHLDKSYRVFNLRTDRACSPRTGLAHDFFVIESSSWVNIIPLTPQKEVVLKPLLGDPFAHPDGGHHPRPGHCRLLPL
jgi:WD40 repeat protein